MSEKVLNHGFVENSLTIELVALLFINEFVN